MFAFIYTLLTLLIFAVISSSLYFKFKKFKKFKKVKKIDKKSTIRKWWHNILIFIIGTISFFVGMMLVRFIFSLFY